MPADDPFDFLEPQAETPAPDAAPPAPAPVEQSPAPDAAPAVEGAPASQPQGEGDRGPIPLATFLDVRDQAKQARREADDLRKQLAERQQQGKQPTVYDDPVAWQAQQDARLEAAETKIRLDMSDRFATQAHGADKVQAARTWAGQQVQSDPTFATRFMAQPDPVGWMVDQHRQSEQLSALGGKSLEEVIQERIKALGLVAPVVDDAVQPPAAQAVPATVAPPVSPPAPPRSLASAPSAGGLPSSGKISEKDIFDATF